MKKAKVTKRFDFHAAHQLPNHAGACKNLHGHSYVFEVTVGGVVKDNDGTSEEGMVVDFSVLKEIYKDNLEPYLEHKFLNETLAPWVDVTTAENIALWILDVFIGSIGSGLVTVEKVQLWETPTSCVTVTPKDLGL